MRLDATDELPTQIFTYLLPDLILNIQFIAILEQGKGRKILIEFQEFAEFIQNIGIRQEIAAILRTVFLKGRLNFLEHKT